MPLPQTINDVQRRLAGDLAEAERGFTNGNGHDTGWIATAIDRYTRDAVLLLTGRTLPERHPVPNYYRSTARPGVFYRADGPVGLTHERTDGGEWLGRIGMLSFVDEADLSEVVRCTATDAGDPEPQPARPADPPPDLQSQVAVLTAQLADAEERERATAQELDPHPPGRRARPHPRHRRPPHARAAGRVGRGRPDRGTRTPDRPGAGVDGRGRARGPAEGVAG